MSKGTPVHWYTMSKQCWNACQVVLSGYRYVTFLTAMHQLVTAGALRGAAKIGLLEPKAIERGALLRFSVLNGVSIGFLNLSLGFNSVGFYQMTKLAIIPCTVGWCMLNR